MTVPRPLLEWPACLLYLALGAGARRPSQSELRSAPRVHHQHRPDTLWHELGYPAATLKRLAAMGHAVTERDEFCDVQAILVLPDGTLSGASDPRESGLTLGF